MYVNNIAERSSSRVLQRPGGQQSFNIFGGADEKESEQPKRTGRGRVQTPPEQAKPTNTTTTETAKPSLNSHSSSIGAVFNEEANTKAASTAVAAVVQPPPRVNNIWGSDDDVVVKSSTRVLRGPGASSSGVAGVLSENASVSNSASSPTAASQARDNRKNQTSVNSPFSTEPLPQRSSTRVAQAPGGQQSNGNILSWGH